MNEKEQKMNTQVGSTFGQREGMSASSIKSTPSQKFGNYQSKYLAYSSKPYPPLNYPPPSGKTSERVIRSPIEDNKAAVTEFQSKTFVPLAISYAGSNLSSFGVTKAGFNYGTDTGTNIIPIKYERPNV
jgi:hypothetical protein